MCDSCSWDTLTIVTHILSVHSKQFKLFDFETLENYHRFRQPHSVRITYSITHAECLLCCIYSLPIDCDKTVTLAEIRRPMIQFLLESEWRISVGTIYRWNPWYEQWPKCVGRFQIFMNHFISPLFYRLTAIQKQIVCTRSATEITKNVTIAPMHCKIL